MTVPILLSSIFLGLGFFIGKLLSKNQSTALHAQKEEQIRQMGLQIEQLQKQISSLSTDKDKLRNEREALTIQLTKKEADFDNLLDRNKEYRLEVEQLQEKFTQEFELLANKILEEKTNKFTEQNKESLKNILTPLQDKIQ